MLTLLDGVLVASGTRTSSGSRSSPPSRARATRSGTTAAWPGTTRSQRRPRRSYRAHRRGRLRRLAPLYLAADVVSFAATPERGIAIARADDGGTNAVAMRPPGVVHDAFRRARQRRGARGDWARPRDRRPARPRVRRRHARGPRADAGGMRAEARLQGLGRAVRPARAARLLASQAERLGLEIVAVSDHFQPWRHHGGHAPSALPGSARSASGPSAALLGTSVLTPTLRYHPAIVAQAFATLALPRPGPGLPRRRHRRGDERDAGDRRGVAGRQGAPAAARRGDRADPAAVDRGARRLRGRVLQDATARRSTTGPTSRCRSTSPPRARSRPSSPGASATASSARAARSPSSTGSCSRQWREGAEAAGRDPARDRADDRDQGLLRPRPRATRATHCSWWAALALTPEQKAGVEDPIEMERARRRRTAEQRATRASSSPTTPRRSSSGSAPYVDLGFDDLVFHAPGRRPAALPRAVRADVLPLLRERFSVATTRQDA